MANFVPKLWVNPFGNISVSRLCEIFFVGYKGVFSIKNMVKDIFLAYIAQKKVCKRAIFGRKLWVNPSKNNVNFSTF